MSKSRHFLFLQGPHGPFFFNLSRLLAAWGARVTRVGFNAGDAYFWPDRTTYLAHKGTVADWPLALDQLLEDGVTDLVVYGDTRPVHATAVAAAKARGLTIHCFEEGYLRPYWVTYERGGANGHSALMSLSVARMQEALAGREVELPEAPAHWGALWHHTWAGCVYHFNVMFRNRAYANWRPHRAISVRRELGLHIRRLALIPFHAAQRRKRTRKLRRSGAPYHLVLLQLGHDAAMLDHSPFATQLDFVRLCIDAFATGAPGHHHLIFKAHPLEDGREPLEREIRRLAAKRGLQGRVQYIPGGKLGPILDEARSAVTVNSTAAQQALWRGLPIKAFGEAVFTKPEFVSSKPLTGFFANPDRPDATAYRDYRHFLLETSQVGGNYYTTEGRANVLRSVVEMMLDAHGPYDAMLIPSATQGQHLAVVRSATASPPAE